MPFSRGTSLDYTAAFFDLPFWINPHFARASETMIIASEQLYHSVFKVYTNSASDDGDTDERYTFSTVSRRWTCIVID